MIASTIIDSTWTTLMWDVATGARVGEVLSLGDCALVRADGDTAIFGGDQIRLLNLDPDVWADTACRQAGRNLTLEEWERFLPGLAYRPTCADL